MPSPLIKIIVLAVVFALGLFLGRLWHVNQMCADHPEEMDQISPRMCFYD